MRTQGISATTMVQIADLAGLQAPSVYYYFDGKRAILLELALDANRIPLKVVSALNSRFVEGGQPVEISGSAIARLWAFVVLDVLALQALPFDIDEVHRFVAEDAESERLYRETRNELTDGLVQLVSNAISDGEIRPIDARWASLVLLSNDEGIQKWLQEVDADSPEMVGEFMADMAIRGLLRDSNSIEIVAKEGRDIVKHVQNWLVSFR